MLSYSKIANQSDCLKHQDHFVSIVSISLFYSFLYHFLYVTLHAKRGLIQISRYGYFHGPRGENVEKGLECE